MTSEDAAAAARKEVTDFYRGQGAFSCTEPEDIDLFLERNHVVRIPEEGLLEVTEGEPASNGYPTLKINGKTFGSNPDLFYWQSSVEDAKTLVESRSEALRFAVLDLEKRRAVLAYLTDKQAKATQYEAERNERRDALARAYTNSTRYEGLTERGRALLDRLIDAEDRAEAIKP